MYRYIRFLDVRNEWIEMGNVNIDVRNAIIDTACFMGAEQVWDRHGDVVRLNGVEIIRFILIRA